MYITVTDRKLNVLKSMYLNLILMRASHLLRYKILRGRNFIEMDDAIV